MKRLTALIVLLLLVLGLGAATVNVAYPQAWSTNIPVNTRYCSTYSQQIYLKSQINHAGEISKLRFCHENSSNGSLNNSHIWKIYMGHITRSAFTSTSDWEPLANLTEVFAGSVPVNLPPAMSEWIEFTLDTPFVYNNTDNLVIAIHANNYTRAGMVSWGVRRTDDYKALYTRDFNNFDIDASNPPEAEEVMYAVPALRLVFPDTEVPAAPELISPENHATLVRGQPLDWVLPT